MGITVRVDYELIDLANESDAVNVLDYVFDDGVCLESVLWDYLNDTDLDNLESATEDNFVAIVKDYLEQQGRKLTRSELEQLEGSGYCTEDDLTKGGVEIEPHEKDEEGRAFVMVEEDPRQQTLFDETGLPPAKVKRYIDGDGDNENH